MASRTVVLGLSVAVLAAGWTSASTLEAASRGSARAPVQTPAPVLTAAGLQTTRAGSATERDLVRPGSTITAALRRANAAARREPTATVSPRSTASTGSARPTPPTSRPTTARTPAPRPTTTRPRTAVPAPAAPRPPAPVSGPTSWPALNAAIARIPGYVPGGIRWHVSSRFGHWGATDLATSEIFISPSVSTARLDAVVRHEYAHVLTVRAYGGDWRTAKSATNAAFGGSGRTGVERAADCMALALGASWTQYTSCSRRDWQRFAAVLLAGRRL